VSRGPSQWNRHPSCTGLLLLLAGFGPTLGDCLSLVVVLLALPAFVRRIHVEDAELERVPGDDYRRYAARTAHLLPLGVVSGSKRLTSAVARQRLAP
jgi:protein-S-isoprenylcysteine O-methyltransferase Ste14